MQTIEQTVDLSVIWDTMTIIVMSVKVSCSLWNLTVPMIPAVSTVGMMKRDCYVLTSKRHFGVVTLIICHSFSIVTPYSMPTYIFIICCLYSHDILYVYMHLYDLPFMNSGYSVSLSSNGYILYSVFRHVRFICKSITYQLYKTLHSVYIIWDICGMRPEIIHSSQKLLPDYRLTAWCNLQTNWLWTRIECGSVCPRILQKVFMSS